jgi:hypothetical protein
MPFGKEALVRSYAEYLASKSKALARQFLKRSWESRLSEAATFRILQKCDVNPQVADHKGGPDFLCTKDEKRFMVEATSFTAAKVTGDTTLKNEMPKEMTGQAYGRLTTQIAERVDDKRYQFAKLEVPGVLAIVSDHFGAGLVLDSHAAQCVLLSEQYWTSERIKVDFVHSGFLRLENEKIIAHNGDISAVLLVAVKYDTSHVCGALHPSPTRPFDSRLLWEIPFVYLKDWPIENNRVRCAGTMGNQESLTVPHSPIRREGA